MTKLFGVKKPRSAQEFPVFKGLLIANRALHNFHEVYITQVLLQIQSSDKVLTAFEAGKRNVPMLLLDVYFQSEPLSGLELAMITVDE